MSESSFGPGPAVMVLEWEQPTDHEHFWRVMEKINEYLHQDEVRPTMIHLGIREVAQEVLSVFEQAKKESEEMALTKHGEGSIIGEEQQKIASKEPMTEESKKALAEENMRADGELVNTEE